MKNIFYLIIIALLMFSCNNANKFPSNNKEFVKQIDSYLTYIDSTEIYEKDYDYIYIKSICRNDTSYFIIYISGGAYDFTNSKYDFIDFIKYKDYDILLKGDFPNRIVNVLKNENKKLSLEIVKERYPNAYKEYLINPNRVAPLCGDPKEIELWFYKDKLIYKK